MKQLTIALTLCALAISPSSFAQKRINLGEYVEEPTEYRGDKNDVLKKVRLELLKGKERVQVALVDFKSSATFSGVDGGKTATAAVKSMLLDGGNIEIIDRNIPKQLLSELQALEMQGVSQGQTFNLAQFAIRGEVLQMTQGATWIDKKTVTKDGKEHTTPPSCTLKGNATVAIKIYNMNPLELVEQFSVDGSSISNFANVKSCQGVTDNGKSVINAVAAAVDENKNRIKNMFTPTGLIYEHRVHMKKKKKHIFATTLSPSDVRSDGGALTIKIFKVTKTKNSLGKQRIEKAQLALGTAKITDSDEVWLEVKHKDASNIQLGDTAVVYSGCQGLKGIPLIKCYAVNTVK